MLDDPVGESLRGHHAHLARTLGGALTYEPDVATFSSLTGPEAWADLAKLLGPGAFADMFSHPATPPADWAPVFVLEGRQMIWTGRAQDVDDVVVLGAADVPEMLDLAGRTKPGPFWARTVAMGTYLGVRDGGTLVVMAGERLHPPGWTEISAVCTAPGARGRGLAAKLVGALVARIVARDERPFLHVAEANTGAIALYERLGFTTRKAVTFRGFRTP
ncbi:GNAT family N-acetyltransferase [Actinophytocola sp. KF-1]